jgi:4-amino-4-deoxy-L-arabinose transferase-like glycosyltransferase
MAFKKFNLLTILGIAFLLLGITIAGRHYIPPDETRYLSVAWDMWLHHDFLVPHLNHLPYSHKPPLLFWLINLGWFVFGVNDWWPRLIPFLFSLGSIFLVRKIADKLWPKNNEVGYIASLLLLASSVWAVYSSALMFDMMLTFFTCLGILGMLISLKEKNQNGFIYLVLAFAGGLLAKGPTILLQLLPLAVTAPWWMKEKTIVWKSWYRSFALSFLVGTAILLCWAIPAGISGGAQYQHDIFWGQTANRMVNSFAHNRPQWWYLEMAPLLIFPWFFVPAFWKLIFQKSSRQMSEGLKFSLAWFFPVFIAFSLISGKQVHYLLPIYPALALMIASEFDRIKKITWFDHAFMGLPLIAAGAIFYYLANSGRMDDAAPWMNSLPIESSFILILGGLFIFIWKTKNTLTFLWKLVTANILLISVMFLGVIYHTGNAYDLREVSRTIKLIEDKNFPVAYLGNYAGQFDFIGRLDNPPQVITTTQLFNWTKEHPEGRVIITFNGKPDFVKIKSQYTSWYRGSHIAILSSDEVNAFCKPKLDVCLEH